MRKSPENLKEYYGLEDIFTLNAVATKRNWIIKNGIPDETRAAVMVLTDFRSGRIGKLTLDNLPESTNNQTDSKTNEQI